MATEKRLINANVVLAKKFTAGLSDASGNYYGHADVVFVNDIENAPTVEAVEVVRCKECKHYDNTEGIQWCYLNSKFAKHGMDWHSFPEDGFCSYGERRTDDERTG